MIDPIKAELDLIIAKQRCFEVCGRLDPSVASDRYLAEKAHEPHRVELEEAYAAFQAAAGAVQASNPASGETPLTAQIVVDSIWK